MKNFKQPHHFSVLAQEALSFWHYKPGGLYVDGTLGLGGHSEKLLMQDSKALCCAIDQDHLALKNAQERLKNFDVRFLHGNFAQMLQLLPTDWIGNVNGILLDLGVSSMQIDQPERGFSFLQSGPLDMRMNADQATSALQLIQKCSDTQLAKIIKDYGEEPLAWPIAKALKKLVDQEQNPDTLQVAGVIENLTRRYYRSKSKNHPAVKTFQALRIAVNQELDALRQILADAPKILTKGGRIVIISFHSLEDRIVKQTFSSWAKPCICPPSFPICACHKKATFKVLTPKVILPSEQEIKLNSRSASAKLRAAEKIL